MNPLDNLSPWNRGESYDPEPPDERMPIWATVAWWFILIGMILLLYAGICAISNMAKAHMGDRPELNDWLMAQRNQMGAVCCDGDDVIRLSDNEWGVENGHYWAMHEGQKVTIPDKHVSPGGNRVSEALLWWWAGQPQCFKPATFY